MISKKTTYIKEDKTRKFFLIPKNEVSDFGTKNEDNYDKQSHQKKLD
jgi:hypothetical protein